MDRLVVIFDELRQQKILILGKDRIQYELRRTVEVKGGGYSLSYDQQLPVTQDAQFNIGIPAAFRFEIDSDESKRRIIDNAEFRLLKNLFSVSTSVKDWIEKVISAISAVSRATLDGSVDRKLRLASIFPEVAAQVHSQLSQVRMRLPYLTISSSDTININQALDGALDEYQRGKLAALQQLISHQLTTAYHPQEELQARKEYYDNLISNWPSINPPSIQELDTLRRIVQGLQHDLMKALLLETPTTPGALITNPTARSCTACGATAGARAKFCTQCGRQL